MAAASGPSISPSKSAPPSLMSSTERSPSRGIYVSSDLPPGFLTPAPSAEDLPSIPENHLSYSEFDREFNLDKASTEIDNLRTKELSTKFRENVQVGLHLLLNEEPEIIKKFVLFCKTSKESIAHAVRSISKRLEAGGRVYLVGVGSSGRVAIDIAVRMRNICPNLKCFGIIGGGDSALIYPQEDFEDSADEGTKVARNLKLCENDVIILISASGTATFNVGFGHEAANQKAKVYYFFNSGTVPPRTDRLFNRDTNKVIPMSIDIGPQAIPGSTRLQGYTIARLCLTHLMQKTLAHLKKLPFQELSPENLSTRLDNVVEKINSLVLLLSRIVKDEKEILSHTLFDESPSLQKTAGFITWLGTKSTLRELTVDTVEIPPTFCLIPPRRSTEATKKRAEVHTFLVGTANNREPWEVLVGRDRVESEWAETSQFNLAADGEGLENFSTRPHGKGNLVIGAELLHKGEKISPAMLEKLKEVKQLGGKTGLIVITEDRDPPEVLQLNGLLDHLIVIDSLEDDPLGLTFSQTLKWVCNLISNGSMILLGKVHGNYMVDVEPSNGKLIFRAKHIVKSIWQMYNPGFISDEEVYRRVVIVINRQSELKEEGQTTPSTVKIVLAMMHRKCSFEEALIHLKNVKENLEALFKE